MLSKKNMVYIYGWIFVRPRRWLFHKMICASFGLKLLPEKTPLGINYPNLHWWILYKTVFRFCSWLHWDAWKIFCSHKNGWITHKPLISKIIKRIGDTTAGYCYSKGECHHCGSPIGNPNYLVYNEERSDFLDDDENDIINNNETFILKEEWQFGFRGITICPICSYRAEYEDNSC